MSTFKHKTDPSPCTRCGHVEKPRNAELQKLCQATGTECCDVCRKLDSLNDEIATSEAHLQALYDQRDALRPQLNAAHPSIIHRLPVEVTALIFAFYASDVTVPEDSPLKLGAVCQRWRETAWSAPNLWTHLELIVYRRGVPESRIQRAQEWIDRSGCLPLTIVIHLFSVDISDPSISVLYPLIDTINRRCDQWYSLSLALPSALLALFDDSCCVSSSLKQLSLSPFEEDDLAVSGLRRVTPQIVKLTRSGLDPAGLNWSRVTDFSTDCLGVDQVLEVLRLAPHLRNCRLRYLFAREMPSCPYTRVNHPNLKTLDVEIENHDGSVGLFFSNLTLPSLQNFQVRGTEHRLEPDELISLLTRSESACMLKNLMVDETDFTGPELVSITRCTPSLEDLFITRGFGDDEMPGYFFQQLSLQYQDTRSAMPLLPCLRKFRWSGQGSFAWQAILAFLCPTSEDSNQNRRPLEVFEIYCEREALDPIPYISADILSELSKFKDEIQFKFHVYLPDEKGYGDLWQMSVDRLSSKEGVRQSVW